MAQDDIPNTDNDIDILQVAASSYGTFQNAEVKETFHKALYQLIKDLELYDLELSDELDDALGNLKEAMNLAEEEEDDRDDDEKK